MSDVQLRLEKLLNRFDVMTEPFSEESIYNATHELHKEISGSDEESCVALQAESMAFGFYEDYPDKETGWGTYYGPMIVKKDDSGQWIEWPSVQQISPDILEYWQKRSKVAKHPVLRCRYADLVWDFTKEVTGDYPDVSFARMVIDEALNIVTKGLCKHQSETITKLTRALSLSLSINDKSRTEAVTNTMIALEDKIAQDDKCGLWGFSFDNLVENKKVTLTQEQENKIISDLEARLKRTSSNEGECNLNPHAAEVSAMRLVRYYHKARKIGVIKRVLRLYGQAFVSASESAGGLVGSSWLQKVFQVFHDNGMKDDANALTERIRKLDKQSNEEMKMISKEIKIPQETIDSLISDMIEGTLDEALTRIVWYFLPDPNEVKEQIKNLAKNTPLQYLVSKTIKDEEGRSIAQIGQLEEDMDGHVVTQTSQNMQHWAISLRMVFEKLMADRNLLPEEIMKYIYQSPIYDKDHREIIEIGVSAYLRGNFIVSAHILIPQIEHALRRLMTLTGGPVYKPGPNGGLLLRNLNEILHDEGVLKNLGEKIVHYLRVVLIDQRGWNLRNDICHGLQAPNSIGPMIGDRLIHILLLLAQIREQRTMDSERM